MLAGCTFVTIPVIIVFLIFQDKVMTSTTAGAVGTPRRCDTSRYGLITGSPCPPASPREEPLMREPAPSLGEDVNLWRHHLLVIPPTTCWLFYNSGSYGQQRMFCRQAQKF